VAHVCELLGMTVLLNDPPRERADGSDQFCSLGEIMQKADIITLHVPLDMQGKDATFHLANTPFFKALKRKPIVINSCRGEVLDTLSAKTALKNGLISGLVVDCWENEPSLDRELLELVDLATPHIAGYSKDGKANGTSMSIQAVSRFFGLGIDHWQAQQVELPKNTIIELDGLNLSEEEIFAKAVLATYDIRTDDAVFRKNPEQFEKLRGDYPVRREYPVYSIHAKNINQETIETLSALGFKIE
jgi:erythronate-4-phosphate dehydrogenase